MNLLSVFVKASKVVTEIGVGMIVSNAIKATTPEDIKRGSKIAIAVGGFALGSMIGAKASSYIEGEIQGFVASIKDGLSTAEGAVIIVEPTDVQTEDTTKEDQNA